MPTTALTNASATSSIASPASAAISAAPEILSGLGFSDRRAEIMVADQAQHNNYLKLRDAIETFEAKPDLINQEKLINILNKEIKRLKAEHKHIKAKQAEYQQAAQKISFGWSDWLLSGVKYIFGSDNTSQAEHYAEMAKAREEQIKRLENYLNEVEEVIEIVPVEPQIYEEDVVELNTDEGIRIPSSEISTMRRKLLTLPVADEFQVNPYPNYAEIKPVIGIQPNGDFVIAWRRVQSNNYGVNAQCFKSNGSLSGLEFEVSAYPLFNVDGRPAIGVQANGNFIIAWSIGSGGNKARYYHANCSALGSEFVVSTTITEYDPTIGVQSNGNFIIVGSGVNNDIRARYFNANSSQITTTDFELVSSLSPSSPYLPCIGIQPGDNFVMSWGTGSSVGIYAKRFNAAGSALGSSFQVNSYTYGAQSDNVLAVQPTGNFIAAWRRVEMGGTGYTDIAVQLFSASGSPIGNEFLANSYTNFSQSFPAIAAQTNGDFMIAWVQTNGPNELPAYARRFNATGFAFGPEFLVTPNLPTGFGVTRVTINAQPNGDYVIAWAVYPNTDEVIHARIFRPLSMGNNALTINQGQTITLTTAILSATSGGTASDITFTVSNVVNGRFEFSNNPGIAIIQFTKQQIIDGVVRIVHNGSSNAPSFSTTVTDGNETLGPFAALINFIPAPVISSSTGVSLLSSSSTAATQTVLSSSSGIALSSSGTPLSSSGNSVTTTASSTAEISLSTSSTAATPTTLFSSSTVHVAHSSSGNNERSSSSSTALTQTALSSSGIVLSSSGNAPLSSSGSAVPTTTSSTANTVLSSSGNDEKNLSSSTAPTQTILSASDGASASSGLSTNAAIGLGAGVGAAALLTAFGIYYYRRTRSIPFARADKKSSSKPSSDKKTPEGLPVDHRQVKVVIQNADSSSTAPAQIVLSSTSVASPVISTTIVSPNSSAVSLASMLPTAGVAGNSSPVSANAAADNKHTITSTPTCIGEPQAGLPRDALRSSITSSLIQHSSVIAASSTTVASTPPAPAANSKRVILAGGGTKMRQPSSSVELTSSPLHPK
jgi:hypothetical protein